MAAGVQGSCNRALMDSIALAASGMFNTTRQVGTVIGTAGVGALLQNRLIAGFNSQIQQRASSLPPSAQHAISASFQTAAKNGLAGGPAQHASSLATAIFDNGFVQAMRPTMLTPILILFAGAACCLFIKQAKRGPAARSRTRPGAPTHNRTARDLGRRRLGTGSPAATESTGSRQAP
jgi:hypothetical protein